MSANVDAMVNEGVNAFKAGRKEEARKDFEKSAQIIRSLGTERISGKLLPQMRMKFKEYGIE